MEINEQQGFWRLASNYQPFAVWKLIWQTNALGTTGKCQNVFAADWPNWLSLNSCWNISGVLCPLLATPPNLIYTKLMQILRMLLDRPFEYNQLIEGSPWNGHFSYHCITPQVHLTHMRKLDLSRLRGMLKKLKSSGKIRNIAERRSQIFYETHISLIGWHWFILFAVQAYSLSSKLPIRKYTNCTVSLLERHFPMPLRCTEKYQFFLTLLHRGSNLPPGGKFYPSWSKFNDAVVHFSTAQVSKQKHRG